MDILSFLLGRITADESGGGGGSEAVLIDKNIIENGTYNASSDNADGYKKVVVAVPVPTLGTKIITQNGLYDASDDGYGGYSELDVDVPNSYSAADEGKVVSSGALVSQSSQNITQNGTYDTTLKNQVVVNVSGATPEYFDVTKPEGVYTTSITELADSVCKGRTRITKFIGNAVTVLRSLVFASCTSLQEVVLPNANNPSGFGTSAFQGCTALKGLVLPSQTGNCYNTFADGCSNMEYYDSKTAGMSQQNAFRNCSKLATIVIRKTDSVSTLNNINNLSGTPFASGGTGGTLYVPSALLSSYQSASNWSTILGYANNQIKSIESTHTDPTAPIDLTTHYADGSLIPT